VAAYQKKACGTKVNGWKRVMTISAEDNLVFEKLYLETTFPQTARKRQREEILRFASIKTSN
jgi:hypothetical protein